jgi:hypothetical protein
MYPKTFFTKLIHHFIHGTKYLRKFVYFCNKKLLEVNNCPIGENSPNLVTLMGRVNFWAETKKFNFSEAGDDNCRTLPHATWLNGGRIARFSNKKNPNLGKFGGVVMSYFGAFYGHLVYYTANSVYFVSVWYFA